MKAAKRWWTPHGGSMVWVAVLMLAIPPMILVMANGVRLMRAVYAVRSATYTACQAAAEAAVNARYYRKTGKTRLEPRTARIAADIWYQDALADLQRSGVVSDAHVGVTVRGVTVSCYGSAIYHTWGVPPTTSLEVVPLHYTAETQARIGRH